MAVGVPGTRLGVIERKELRSKNETLPMAGAATRQSEAVGVSRTPKDSRRETSPVALLRRRCRTLPHVLVLRYDP